MLLDAQRLVGEETGGGARLGRELLQVAAGRKRSLPYGVSRTATPSGTSVMDPAGRCTTAMSSVRSATSTR